MKTKKTITTFLLLVSLSFCTTKVNAQTDSTVNNDELVSPTNMDAPGIVAFLSFSSLYLSKFYFLDFWDDHYENEMNWNTVEMKKEKNSMTIYFDPKTVAMKVVIVDQERKIKINLKDRYNPVIENTAVGKAKQKPMYFDNNGYIYTYAGKKQGYIKVLFDKFKRMMPSQSQIFGATGLPGIGFPDGSVTYYGMDVSPKKFPVLEWAFVYKPLYFEVDDFSKEIVQCLAGPNCLKYTLIAGEDAGSYVLFDSKNRLREIHTKKNGYIIYNYQEVNVKLPEAKDMSAYF